MEQFSSQEWSVSSLLYSSMFSLTQNIQYSKMGPQVGCVKRKWSISYGGWCYSLNKGSDLLIVQCSETPDLTSSHWSHSYFSRILSLFGRPWLCEQDQSFRRQLFDKDWNTWSHACVSFPAFKRINETINKELPCRDCMEDHMWYWEFMRYSSHNHLHAF